MTKKKGEVIFSAHNGIDVYVEIPPKKHDPDRGLDLATYRLAWSEDPVEFANDLHQLADFIEHHRSRKIKVDVD